MRRIIVRIMFFFSLGMVFLLANASSSKAQVKRVQMHIEGYLCGN